MKVIPACALSLGSLQFIATSVFVKCRRIPTRYHQSTLVFKSFRIFHLTELCNDLLFQMASKYKLQTLMTSASNAIRAISFISHCISALQGLTLLCKVLLPNIPLNCNFYNFKPKSFYVFRLTFNGRKYRLQFVISLLFIVLQFPHKSSKRPFGHHDHAYQLP